MKNNYQFRFGWFASVIITAVLSSVGLPTEAEAKNIKNHKVDVCHYDEEENAFELINISKKAVAKHIANHGDGYPLGVVPEMDGYVFNAGCVPLGAPSITTEAELSVEENETFVVDIESTDPEGETEGNDLIYGITQSVDATSFGIDQETGVLTFAVAPDFEDPSDYDGDNVYEVEVTVFDSDGLIGSKLFLVTVEDVDEDSNLLVIAFTDVDPSDGEDFVEGIDYLIAKIIDGPGAAADGIPGAGDLVVIGQFPDDVSGDTRVPVSNNMTTVVNNADNRAYCGNPLFSDITYVHDIAGHSYRWVVSMTNQGVSEFYMEIHGTTRTISSFNDGIEGPTPDTVVYDAVRLNNDSPSRPKQTEEISYFAQSNGDDEFIDVRCYYNN